MGSAPEGVIGLGLSDIGIKYLCLPNNVNAFVARFAGLRMDARASRILLHFPVWTETARFLPHFSPSK